MRDQHAWPWSQRTSRVLKSMQFDLSGTDNMSLA